MTTAVPNATTRTWPHGYQQQTTNNQRRLPRHANGRQVRLDALPEHSDYGDGGCDLSPSCLRCPLARCRYDEPGGARRIRRGSRDRAVQRFHDEGVDIDALASQFGVSRRSIFRILARGGR